MIYKKHVKIPLFIVETPRDTKEAAESILEILPLIVEIARSLPESRRTIFLYYSIVD